MPHRAVPPAHSPVSLRSIGLGLRSLRAVEAVARVEDLLRAEFGGRLIRLTDSGTSALRLALETAVRIRPGPVALPAYGCYDLLSAAHGAGVEIVFYDLDPDTLAPDPETLRRAVDVGSRTLVIAYLHGIPFEVDSLARLAREHGAWLIEDAAQSQGADLGGRPLGSFGDASVLSFARGKGRTGGGGGALLAHSAELTESLRLRGEAQPVGSGGQSIARALIQWLFGRPSLYAVPLALPFVRVGETVYREPTEVRSIAPATCAILEANWGASSAEAAHRRAQAERLRERLSPSEGFRCVTPPENSTPGYLRFPVLIDPDRGLDPHDRSLRRLGVVPGYPRTLPEVRPRETDSGPGRRDGARLLVERLWTLPTHGRVRPADLSAILDALGARA